MNCFQRCGVVCGCLGVVVVFCLVLMVGCGGRERQIVVEGAWVRENIPPQKVTGAYLVLKNSGEATALVSASTDVADVTELHVMTAQENVMRMRRVERIPVPEGGVTMLQPGGNHLMLIGLTRDLKSGELIDLTLEFAQGQKMVVQAEVKKVGSK